MNTQFVWISRSVFIVKIILAFALLIPRVALLKNSYVKRISDTFNVQFRAEFFNIVNHTNFSTPLDNRNVFDSNGNPIGNAGLMTSTQTSSRQIQFALKLIW